MPEPGKPDRWNSLLETLGVPVSEKPKEAAPEAAGAEAPPASTAKTQPMSMLRPEKPKAAPKPKPAAPAAKSPSYWSRIAGALGLESAAAPEPAVDRPAMESPAPAAAEEPRHARVEESAREARRPQRHEREREFPSRGHERPMREERPPREERSRRDEPQRTSEPPARSPLDEMLGAQDADVDVFGLGVESESPRMREPSSPHDREEEERGSVLDYDVPEGTGSDLAIEEAPPREFGARGEEGREREGRRRRRRRGRGRRGGGESRGEAPPRHETDIEPAGEEADFDLERDAELDLEAERPSERDEMREIDEPGLQHDRGEETDRYVPTGERPRRDERGERGGRRRRGRRRGSDREREEGAAARPAGYRSEEDERERFGAPRSERQPPARTSQEAEDEIDDDLQGIADEADEGRPGDVPTHKKIPTWDEAVGILIEANMASRANNPERERGRGRGRGRR
jgi:hypothetical protein